MNVEIQQVDEQELEIVDISEHNLDEKRLSEDSSGVSKSWPHAAILCLLENYKKFKNAVFSTDDESKPARQFKRKIWELVSNELRVKGFSMSAEESNQKFRNLKRTFRTLEDGKKGRDSIVRWKYYDLVEDILRDDENTDESLIIVTKEDHPPSYKWTDDSIHTLMKLYKELRDEFLSTNTKRRVWEKLARSMQDSGFMVGADECDQKFRNLKRTFRVCLYNKLGKESITWPFFNMFWELFNHEYSVITVDEQGRTISTDNKLEITNMVKVKDEVRKRPVTAETGAGSKRVRVEELPVETTPSETTLEWEEFVKKDIEFKKSVKYSLELLHELMKEQHLEQKKCSELLAKLCQKFDN